MSETNTLPPSLSHPAVWHGEELFTRSDWSYTWTDADITELTDALKHSESAGSLEECTSQDFPLPTLTEKLAIIQHNLEHGCGACMIRGFPVDRFDEQQCRRIFWGIASHIGTPISQSAKGEKIFSVRDEGYKIGQPEARGPNTSKRLSFHTDRCDVIGFLCLKQAKSGGENQLVSSMALFNALRERHPDMLRTLMQPYYYLRHNVDTGNERPWCRQPIFSFREGHFAASFLRVLIERAYASADLPDMSEQERKALDTLEEVAADPGLHVTFRQDPGDMLLLNNWVTFHRRNEFVDHDDPELRRHLLRIWLAVPNSRPLDPLFADNYGSTEAGAVRGGMRAQMS